MCGFWDTVQKQGMVGGGAADIFPLGGSRHLGFRPARSPARSFQRGLLEAKALFGSSLAPTRPPGQMLWAQEPAI